MLYSSFFNISGTNSLYSIQREIWNLRISSSFSDSKNKNRLIDFKFSLSNIKTSLNMCFSQRICIAWFLPGLFSTEALKYLIVYTQLNKCVLAIARKLRSNWYTNINNLINLWTQDIKNIIVKIIWKLDVFVYSSYLVKLKEHWKFNLITKQQVSFKLV